MFDNPIADRRPCKLLRMGFPWHGLLEFPQLEGAVGAPRALTKLTTHGGRVVYPLADAGGTVSPNTILDGTQLWMDARAVHVPEDPETGEDWSGYLCISRQGAIAGELAAAGIQSVSRAGIYSSGAGNHVWSAEFGYLRVYNEIAISRRSRPEHSFDYVDLPVSILGRQIIADATPCGADVLLHSATASGSSGVRQLTFSGVWPDINASLQTLLPAAEVSIDETVSSGTPPGFAPRGYFAVVAVCRSVGLQPLDQNCDCGYVIYDELEPEATQLNYTVPHVWRSLTTRRWLVAAHFTDSGGALGQLFFEDIFRNDIDHSVDKGLDSAAIEPGIAPWTEVGLLVVWHLNTDSNEENEINWALRSGDSKISSARFFIGRRAISLDKRTVTSGGLQGVNFGGTEGVYEQDVEYSLETSGPISLVFDGINVLERFPEINFESWAWTERQSQTDYTTISDRSTPIGESRRLHFRVLPYFYARDLCCMRMQCIYQRLLSGQIVETRTLYIYGAAYYKGAIDPEVYETDSSQDLYGAGCPLTKKIARNYTYPVAWI